MTAGTQGDYGRRFAQDAKLPPVFPLVLYVGEPPWDGVQDLSERNGAVPGLMA